MVERGKHHHHGGNIQVVSAPDGWPLWTSQVRPGREHDTTAARTDPDLLAQIRAWVDDGQLGLADLGYEGEADLLRIPIKKPAGGELTVDQQAYNAVCAMRCSVISLAKRGEIGGISLDLMANPAPKGNIGENSMPGN